MLTAQFQGAPNWIYVFIGDVPYAWPISSDDRDSVSRASTVVLGALRSRE